ncbi:MAG: hypothetical protein IJR45_05775, partial [Firmicutes bacterium]|nr:hypothetical protein [Bacillota bacterium]
CIIAPISSWAAAVSGDLFTTPRRVNAEDVPAIIILTFAWTLKTMTSLFEAGQFVSGVVQNAFVVLGIFAVLMLTVLFGIKLYRKAQRS